MSELSRPVSILVAALGGEGGGVLAEWLMAAAARAGYVAQSTSIPGVAQRTGATTYYVEIHPVPRAALGSRMPVLGLLPVPGRVDLVVASELLEAARTVQAGMTSPERTLLVTSTSRTLTTAEKIPLGDGRFDPGRLLDVARKHSRDVVAFDMSALARDAGTVVSAVMFGAVAASGALPFGRDVCAAAIEGTDRGAEASRAGFRAACAAMDRRGAPSSEVAPTPAVPIPDFVRTAFPAVAQPTVALGHARVAEFQDAAYGQRYLERVGRILAAERAADPEGERGRAITCEAARYLALWMAFDDVVRVADLKCRASRFARVRRELAARPGDVVRLFDFFRPGLPEFAGLLPPSLAARLAAWDRRRQARGKPPIGWSLRIRTDAIGGFLALRALAGLRGWRRRGARFAEEQRGIERWLDAIVAAAAVDWTLAHEIALAARIVKGYGATLERGKENLHHILAHLAAGGDGRSAALRAQAV
ncbi:MAG TPA: indolepyruvate oxidoreductase subunit beta family protein, partial [Solirubrobacteraceae bacterium]|nr:indolepyruvate oxidoreductase subunit beta family protein [Solirubrobacteraceae bacterium]